ncbi:MAG TPA: monovalent cation/H+ antiporter subunit D family protein [Parvibaculum sp.]
MLQSLVHHLPVLQIVLPLVAAPLCAALGGNGRGWFIAFTASLVAFVVAVALFASVIDGTVISYQLGGWAPPLGIEYRVDILNAFVLVIVSGVSVLSLFYARASIAAEVDSKNHAFFYSTFILCMTGLLGVTVTGDAFNVFVFLEISSLSAYALISSGAKRDRRALTAAYNYLVMGTIGATFFVIGLGLLYMLTGTLNMADLAARLVEQGDSRTLRMGFAFILVGVALKLAMFPLHLWLPNAYTYAPSAVSAFLSATATKVAVYVLVRFLFVIFGFGNAFEANVLHVVMLPLALIAVFAAGLVAIFADDLKRMLAWSSIGQIGYILIGISLLSHEGLMAAVIHLFNHAVAKAALFMVAGCFVMQAGTTSIRDLRGIARDMPWTSAAFVVAGMSLVGVPFTVGFISKWYLVQAALTQNEWPLALLIVASSLLTLAYIWRIIETIYMRAAPEGVHRTEAPLTMLIPAWVFAGLCLYFGFDASLTSMAASRAANALIGASNLFWQ